MAAEASWSSAAGNNTALAFATIVKLTRTLLTAVLNTFLPIPAAFSETLVQIGKFMIVMAMTAIGLNTNLKRLLTNGLKPICLGLCCWFMVAVVSLLVQHFIGMI